MISCSNVEKISITTVREGINPHRHRSIAGFEYLEQHPSLDYRIKTQYITDQKKIDSVALFLKRNLILKLPNDWTSKLLAYQESEIGFYNYNNTDTIDGKYEPSLIIDVTNRIVFQRKIAKHNDTLYLGGYRSRGMIPRMKIIKFKKAYYIVPINFRENLNKIIPILY